MESAPVLDGSRTTCTSCHAPLVLLRTGYTCPRCGIVQGINYVDDDSSMASHYCCDVRSPEQAAVHGKHADLASSLGSYIGYSNTRHFRDAKHAPLPHHKQLLFRRLQDVLETRYILANHYYRYGIVTIVKMAAEDLDISPVVQQRALCLYSKVITCVGKMGYHLVSFITTALYVASRECASPVPFTIQELCHALQAHGHWVTVKMIFKHVPTFKHR
nr:cyclin family protein [Candidatus Sigynarchaeota archaeon]